MRQGRFPHPAGFWKRSIHVMAVGGWFCGWDFESVTHRWWRLAVVFMVGILRMLHTGDGGWLLVLWLGFWECYAQVMAAGGWFYGWDFESVTHRWWRLEVGFMVGILRVLHTGDGGWLLVLWLGFRKCYTQVIAVGGWFYGWFKIFHSVDAGWLLILRIEFD